MTARKSGFTYEQRTTARHWCAQNADHFATSSPLSAFFTEVVCGLGTTPPQVAASSPPIGGNDAIQGSVRPRRCRPRATNRGNCTTRGCDTPATHRQRASCSAKPPPLPVSSALQGPRARMGHRWVAETRQLHTRKVPRRNKSRPARAARPHFRYKTLPAHPSHRMCGTKLSLHARPRRISGIKLSLLTRNGPIWRNLRMQGEFCTVLTTKKPSRENFVPNAGQRRG